MIVPKPAPVVDALRAPAAILSAVTALVTAWSNGVGPGLAVSVALPAVWIDGFIRGRGERKGATK